MHNYSLSQPIARAELTHTRVAELADLTEFAADAELTDLSAQLAVGLPDLTDLTKPKLIAEWPERTKLAYLADLPDLAERNSPDRSKLTDLADLSKDADLTNLTNITNLAKLSQLDTEADLANLADLPQLADLSNLAHDADLRKARIAIGADVASLHRGKLVNAAHLRKDLR